MKGLLNDGLLHGDCMTVTGKTVAENIQYVKAELLQQDTVKVWYSLFLRRQIDGENRLAI